MAFTIVLVEPEIPQNAGNISRTCAVTGCKLIFVRPLGFEVTDKHLKRAGLDYWQYLDISYYDSIEEVMDKFYNGSNFHFFSTKSNKIHSEAKFKDGDFLVFGKETKGLPEELLLQHEGECLRIPMFSEARSLNLSNSVAVALYEALRQSDYAGLLEEGELHNHKWNEVE
jgi:tRNA (cytidine/uridine-2'-O-)-methyltransferase